MRELHLFAGAGGGILGGMLLGHTTVCAVEIEPYCQEVLRARQRDGILPEFPIFGDIREFDGRPWRGAVDVLCGGFPCQDISAAGKGAGITGERSGLWKEYARLIGEIRPQFVFAENSPLLRTRGLGVVLEDLAALGYHARWGIMGARHVGAPHKRDRMWVLAHTMQTGLQRKQCTGRTNEEGRQEPARPTAQCGGLWWHTDPAEVDDSTITGLEGTERSSIQRASERPSITNQTSWPTEPIVGRVANELANKLDIKGGFEK
jgi:DNA (cytosine-5)-methyltransferase 1